MVRMKEIEVRGSIVSLTYYPEISERGFHIVFDASNRKIIEHDTEPNTFSTHAINMIQNMMREGKTVPEETMTMWY